MPNERVSMSKLKQLIALQASNLSVRATARALGLSVGAVSKYLRAVRAAGIGPAEAESLAESELEARVFGPNPPGKPPKLVPPDCECAEFPLLKTTRFPRLGTTGFPEFRTT
jgi:transcriptional regulator with XRE-family HTH domain